MGFTKSRVTVNKKRIVGIGLSCNRVARRLRKFIRVTLYEIVKGVFLKDLSLLRIVCKVGVKVVELLNRLLFVILFLIRLLYLFRPLLILFSVSSSTGCLSLREFS